MNSYSGIKPAELCFRLSPASNATSDQPNLLIIARRAVARHQMVSKQVNLPSRSVLNIVHVVLNVLCTAQRTTNTV